jgi:hypothetical protein
VSRSGYSDDYDDPLQVGRWRAIVASATRGKRGQLFFRDLVTALDSMPAKSLASSALETKEGAVCALGALGRHRGVDLRNLDTYDWDQLGETFNVARQLTQEVMYENDESWIHDVTGEKRWKHVRDWAAKQIVPTEEELASP